MVACLSMVFLPGPLVLLFFEDEGDIDSAIPFTF